MTEHLPQEDREKSTTLSVVGQSTDEDKSRGLFAYFRDSYREFKKVVWPSREDATKMTMFVIIFVAVLSAFIYLVDTAISWLFFDVLLKKG